LLLWIAASASASYDEASAALETGEDFAQEQWKNSPLVGWARDNAGNRPLYTNWTPVVFFQSCSSTSGAPRTSCLASTK
jgi:hypothetical protein